MPRMIFVNLPVRDLPASIAFFEAVGFTLNPAFTDDTAACMVVSDTIYVMLLTHAKFAQFINGPIADARQATGVLIALSCDSPAAVDDTVAKALAAGGKPWKPVMEYPDFMYGHSFQDPDGHVFEVMWMNPAAAAGGAPPA